MLISGRRSCGAGLAGRSRSALAPRSIAFALLAATPCAAQAAPPEGEQEPECAPPSQRVGRPSEADGAAFAGPAGGHADAACASSTGDAGDDFNYGRNAAQRQHGGDQREPARADGASNPGLDRHRQSAANSGTGLSDHHGYGPGRCRRDRRRCTRRRCQLLDASIQWRPDQYALQRHQDWPVQHDIPRRGREQPGAGRFPQRSGLAIVR